LIDRNITAAKNRLVTKLTPWACVRMFMRNYKKQDKTQ